MRFQVLAVPLMVLMMILVSLNFFNWSNEAIYELQERQLDIQVNYAIDAATQEMMRSTSSIETDYADWKNVKVDPVIAYNTYVSLILRNLGWADTEVNRNRIESEAIPFFCVAAYDGYYMMLKQPATEYYNGEDIGTTYSLRWMPKIPYSYSYVDAGVKKYCAFNLNYGNYMEFDGVTINLKADPNQYTSKFIQKDTVSKVLSEACTYALYDGLEGRTDVVLYIPAEMSSWQSSSPIQGPSCLTYLCVNNGWIEQETVTFGIGGARIEENDYCICYIRDGERLYTYAYNRQVVEAMGVTVLEITTTPKAAARKGFSFDMVFFR